jgi:alpha-tubulin suppressor-like RCC1 family protein
LGNGTTTNSDVPVSVSLPAGTTVSALAAGDSHGLAMTSGGQVLAWGYNDDGELGNGTTTSSTVPVSVSLPTGTTVNAVVTHGYHTVALTSAGQLLTWGYNYFGQLGNGTTTNSAVPISVPLPTGTTVTNAATGHYHTMVLTSAGQVLTWGDNESGQLGNGTNDNSSVPVSVSLPSGTTVTDVAGGGLHSLARTSAGQVLTWGMGAYGESGDGNNTSSTVPIFPGLPSGTTITAVGGGFYHSVAMTG